MMNKVLQIAENEVGYLEKASNSNLDDKTANAGKGNFTKYWRDLAPGMQGQAWCNAFIDWIFTKAYGEAKAKELLCTTGAWSFYTPTSASYFKKKAQWFGNSPKAGDIIFFKNSTRICHVGIVYKVDATKVYTIEGNTSAGSGVIANGGGVAKKSYKLSYNKIAGYGRPAYSEKNIIKDEPVPSKPTLRVGSNNEYVKAWQTFLSMAGFYKGSIDGIFGNEMLEAVKKYQAANDLTPDGIIGAKTWAALPK